MALNFTRLFSQKLAKKINISYALTVCNEADELDKLLGILLTNMDSNDEIIILSDQSNVTDKVKHVIKRYEQQRPIKHISYPLAGDFATFKNNLIKAATKRYLFQIDADEFPHEVLFKKLKIFLFIHFYADCFYVPRVNMVEGISNSHIEKWNWRTEQSGRINFPDYQMRIFKLGKNIRWQNKVHERLVNYRSKKKLPCENEDFCLYHLKTIDRQEKQNALYDTMAT